MKRLLVGGMVCLIGWGAIGSAIAQPPPGYAPIPPPRHEVVPPPPPGGRVVWEPGHWHWDGVRYVWIGGHYVERRPGHWVPGHWVWAPRQGRWVWAPAHWQ
ncbi:MAG TPA: hypothetical protein VHB27_13615 [Rhodopila sp.]|uniref:hypothetical protein n=1 Tax=Rhodopila sp. TaxID=2480087 RepID=UPI002B807DE5|nr:hypothetical protein [Rhodopila sp.]HVY16257.1 hypothetical protein [Rhodopila sp.]